MKTDSEGRVFFRAWGIYLVLMAGVIVAASMALYWREKNTSQCLACEVPSGPTILCEPVVVDIPVDCPPCPACPSSSPTLNCSLCFADTDPCLVCEAIKDN